MTSGVRSSKGDVDGMSSAMPRVTSLNGGISPSTCWGLARGVRRSWSSTDVYAHVSSSERTGLAWVTSENRRVTVRLSGEPGMSGISELSEIDSELGVRERVWSNTLHTAPKRACCDAI